jgi:transposase
MRANRPLRGRPTKAGSNRQRHSSQPGPEQLQRDNERLRRENEDLRRKVAERDQQIADAETQIADAGKQIADAETQIADAEKQIADLERQLALRQRNSTNSSKPPSSDGLAGAQRPRGRKLKSKRKPGGQPGHAGHHRRLVPAAEVSAIEVMLPHQCRHCERNLPQQPGKVTTEGELRRHQVTDLPPVKAHITEYQFPNVVCGHCGKATRMPLPAEIAGQFGPQLTALIAYLTVFCRLPRRVVETMLADLLGIEISLGSTQKAWEEVSQAVEQPVAHLQEQLPHQAVLNVDETGWRTNGDKRWMWALVAGEFAFYVVATQRNTAVLVSLLGVIFRGILCSDRYTVYLNYHSGKMQLCWAHLKRAIQGILDHPQSLQAERFARDALAQYASLFRLWWKFRAGLIDRPQLMERSKRIKSKFRSLAVSYWDSHDRDVANLANAFGEHPERLFTFLEEPGVEPTNNKAERALRRAVQWRKTSFGNRSRQGEIAVGRMLTVVETCRMQDRHVLGYLSAAVACHRRRTPVAYLSSPQLDT